MWMAPPPRKSPQMSPRMNPPRHYGRSLLLLAGLACIFASSLAVEEDGSAAVTPTTLNSTFNMDAECHTDGCNRTVSALEHSMNTSADPCDNFFEFVCGRYVNNTPIPPDRSSVSVVGQMEEQLRSRLNTLLTEPVLEGELRPFKMAKMLYRSCTNTSRLEELGLEPARKMIKALGGWPVLEGDSWNGDEFDWKEMNYKTMKEGLYGDYLFMFGLFIDITNTSRYTISLGMPELILDLKAYAPLMALRRFSDYIMLASKTVKLFADPATLNETRVHMEMTEMAILERDLNARTRSLEQRRDVTLRMNPMNVSTLQEKYPYVPWLEYIKNLLPPGSNLTEEEIVIVQDPEFFRGLGDILRNYPKRTLANYMMWRTVQDMMLPYLNSAAWGIHLQFETGSSGVARPRWEECVKLVQHNMRLVTSAMYVRRFSSEEARRNARELVHDISKEMYHLLESVEWMDASTRRAAMMKAEIMRYNVAFPDELLNDTILEEHFSGINLDEEHLLENSMELERDSRLKNGMKLHTDFKKQDWTYIFGIADIVNAFYAHGENSLSIPAGILQGAFFDNDRPQYMNYGGIGYAIGHEVSHGFDETGRLFNKDGLMSNWWDKETKIRFDEKVRCIVEQYSNLTSKVLDLKVNGVITQSENIADNAALKLAYRAYRRYSSRHEPEPRIPLHFTNSSLTLKPRQMFWVSFASVWCSKDSPKELDRKLRTSDHLPGLERVNGAVRNQEAFAVDFSCPPGAAMNPIHKCEVW